MAALVIRRSSSIEVLISKIIQPRITSKAAKGIKPFSMSLCSKSLPFGFFFFFFFFFFFPSSLEDPLLLLPRLSLSLSSCSRAQTTSA